jgi:hypothetical protein
VVALVGVAAAVAVGAIGPAPPGIDSSGTLSAAGVALLPLALGTSLSSLLPYFFLGTAVCIGSFMLLACTGCIGSLVGAHALAELPPWCYALWGLLWLAGAASSRSPLAFPGSVQYSTAFLVSHFGQPLLAPSGSSVDQSCLRPVLAALLTLFGGLLLGSVRRARVWKVCAAMRHLNTVLHAPPLPPLALSRFPVQLFPPVRVSPLSQASSTALGALVACTVVIVCQSRAAVFEALDVWRSSKPVDSVLDFLLLVFFSLSFAVLLPTTLFVSLALLTQSWVGLLPVPLVLLASCPAEGQANCLAGIMLASCLALAATTLVWFCMKPRIAPAPYVAGFSCPLVVLDRRPPRDDSALLLLCVAAGVAALYPMAVACYGPWVGRVCG